MGNAYGETTGACWRTGFGPWNKSGDTMKFDKSLLEACLDTIKLRSFAKTYDKTFALTRADTQAQKTQAYRLRYRVYCEEHGLEPPAETGSHLDQDYYDDNAVHYLLTHCKTGQTAGTLRLVLPRPQRLDESLPSQKFCDHPLLQNTRKIENLCEISRFCVAPEFRRRPGDGRFLCSFSEQDPSDSLPPFVRREIPYAPAALLRGAMEAAMEHKILDCVWMVEPEHLWSLDQIGFPYRSLGPHLSYHGNVQPIIFNIKAVLDAMRMRSPQCWEVISDSGRLDDMAAQLYQDSWHDHLIDAHCLDQICEKLAM